MDAAQDGSDDQPVGDGSGDTDPSYQGGYFIPPQHLLPWPMNEEEWDAHEELLLCKTQQMWDEKYSTYLHHFGSDHTAPIPTGGGEGVSLRKLGFSSNFILLYFFYPRVRDRVSQYSIFLDSNKIIKSLSLSHLLSFFYLYLTSLDSYAVRVPW